MKPAQQKAIQQRLQLEAYRIYENNKKEYERRCISAISASIAVSLHDKFGWTKDDINKLFAYSTANFDAMLEKFVKLEDFEEWAKDYGIAI